MGKAEQPWSPEPSNENRGQARLRATLVAVGLRFLTPDTPGLTEQRKTPHAAATFGVLTELAGSRPPGPGAPEI